MLCVILSYIIITTTSLLPGFQGGVGLLNAYLLRFVFFYIYIPGDGSPIPGEFIPGFDFFLRQFGDFWQDFEKHKYTPVKFTRPFQVVRKNEKRCYGGPFLGRFFFYKKLMIVFFL